VAGSAATITGRAPAIAGATVNEMRDIGEKLAERIGEMTGDLVELTRELIRFPTVNPPGEAYTPCARFIGDRLGRAGFEVQYVRGENEPGDNERYPRTNVIARREGGAPGPTVHFNSHIDVVEAGSGWSCDPFGADVRDGRIFGRGACDMKGGLAASIIAVEAYIAVNPAFAGAIEISGTVDEESGGYGGVAYLARRGYFSKPRVDHVIIPEPLDKDRICLGHRGAWWAEIETKGEIAHGSMPFLGDCAIRHMGAVLEAFERELFPALGRKETSMPVVPDGARRSTMNINAIHGGQTDAHTGLPSPNVPDSCKVTIDRRFLIEEDIDDVKSEVVAILERLKTDRSRFDYAIRDLMEILPTMADEDTPVAQAVASGIRAVLGREPQYIISPGTYDQKHITRIGHLRDCIAYGPGMLSLAHRPDEFIVIVDMVESARVMALAIDQLLCRA
jgi:succinyl-diaminopimelate desuccinylase